MCLEVLCVQAPVHVQGRSLAVRAVTCSEPDSRALFHVLVATSVTIVIFWNVAPCTGRSLRRGSALRAAVTYDYTQPYIQ